MSNICTNQLTITNDAFKKIAHLFTQPEETYEKPYLDFARIVPIPEGGTALASWSVHCRPYNTSICSNGSDNGSTIIEFQTHWVAPHQAIEALVRQFKIEAQMYSFEPGCKYTCITNYTFDDGFNPKTDDVSEFLSIEYDKDDINDTCLNIFGMSFDDYQGSEDDE